MTARECPKCGVTNQSTTERCDCGYSFAGVVVRVRPVARVTTVWHHRLKLHSSLLSRFLWPRRRGFSLPISDVYKGTI